MARQISVGEFIRMTPFQKVRLQQQDPEQYKKLFESMEQNFPKEDPEMASILSNVKSPNSVHTIE